MTKKVKEWVKKWNLKQIFPPNPRCPECDNKLSTKYSYPLCNKKVFECANCGAQYEGTVVEERIIRILDINKNKEGSDE